MAYDLVVSSQRSPGIFFRGLLSSRTNLPRLEGGDVMHEHNIVHKCIDGRDASFIRVCGLMNFFSRN